MTKEELISQITSTINANGNQDITGTKLQEVLVSIVGTLYSAIDEATIDASPEDFTELILQSLGTRTNATISQNAITNAIRSVNTGGNVIPRFARVEHLSADIRPVVIDQQALIPGEIVYVTFEPSFFNEGLYEGFYLKVESGEYYTWFENAHLYKTIHTSESGASFYLPRHNKLFECEADGKQYFIVQSDTVYKPNLIMLGAGSGSAGVESNDIPKFDGIIEEDIVAVGNTQTYEGIYYSVADMTFVAKLGADYYLDFDGEDQYNSGPGPITNRLFEYNKQLYMYDEESRNLRLLSDMTKMAGYTYIGTATSSTTPVTLIEDSKVFYIATEEGDYSNFGLGNISELSVIKSENGSWKIEGLGVPFYISSDNLLISDMLQVIAEEYFSEKPHTIILNNRAIDVDGTVTAINGVNLKARNVPSGEIAKDLYLIGAYNGDVESAVYGAYSDASLTQVLSYSDVIFSGTLVFLKITIPEGTKRIAYPEQLTLYARKSVSSDNEAGIVDVGESANIMEALKSISVETKSRQLTFTSNGNRSFYKCLVETISSNTCDWGMVGRETYKPVEVISNKHILNTGVAASYTGFGVFKYIYEEGYDYYFEGQKAAGTSMILSFYEEDHDIDTGKGYLGRINTTSVRYSTYFGAYISDTSVFNDVTIKDFSKAKYMYASVTNKNCQVYRDVKPYIPEFEFPQIINNPLPKKSLSEGLSILYIGSSFMKDSYFGMGETCFAQGLKITTGNYFKSACTFQDLLDRWEDSTCTLAVKHPEINESTGRLRQTLYANCPVKEVLTKIQWDVIVIANGAATSTDWSQYSDKAAEFIRRVRMVSPHSTIANYQAWKYRDTNNDDWRKVNEVSKNFFKMTGIDVIIPTGKAIYTYLTSEGSQPTDVYRDDLHLSWGLGRYVAACTSFTAIISAVYKISVKGNTLRTILAEDESNTPHTFTDEQAAKAQNCALIACSDIWNYNDYFEV